VIQVRSNYKAIVYLVVFLVCLSAHPVVASSALPTVQIAEANIEVPVPEGFAWPTQKAKRLIRRGELSTVQDDRLLLMFATPEDIAAEEKGQNALMEQYMLLQTTRIFEPHTLRPNQFQRYKQQVRDELATQYEAILPDVQKNWDNYFNEMARLGRGRTEATVVGIGSVGLFYEDSTAVAISGITYSDVVKGGEEKAHFTATATILTLVKGKILWLQVYSTYHAASDLEWVKSTSVRWLREFRSVNH